VNMPMGRSGFVWARAPRVVAALVGARCVAAVVAMCAAFALAVPAVATAAPIATLVSMEPFQGRVVNVYVNSPSMGRVMKVQVLPSMTGSGSSPTVYMLDGVEQTTRSAWLIRTDIEGFFADKNVNVVLPLDVRGSFYTDWEKPDPVLGVLKWETFLTVELPPLIDSLFDGNGRNAIAGLSMGGSGALTLAMRAPHLYQSVASYSGCANSGGVLGEAGIRSGVNHVDGDATNMWGPWGGPEWAAHDVSINAEKLRGKSIYLSAASGLAQQADWDDYGVEVIAGSVIETASAVCTTELAARLVSLGIPVDFALYPVGIHQWRYWAPELAKSWPTIARGLGVA
jgi:S-formylglutathione hydrolase FrmB